MATPSLVANRFEIGEPVASGGMGTVYRAVDRASGQPVALKLQAIEHPGDAARFDREAAALATLNHAGIVRYIAHGTSSGSERFLAMEWIEGENLATSLVERGSTIADAVLVARQAAEALSAAHDLGLVHRDIKPENLMLADGAVERIRVVDFGLARRMVEDHKLTATGFALGTPGYMAPEQVNGVRSLDGRADVFSLGCVLYECLAGHSPFSGENPLAVQLKVLMLEPPSVIEACPEIPEALAAIVSRMIAKAPEARFATMREVGAALAALGPLPDVHRPSCDDRDAATSHLRAVPRESAECLVVAALRRPNDAWIEQARAAATPWPDCDVLRDGALVVRHRGTVDAARCALALAAALPDATLVVTIPAPGSRQLDDVIDRSTQVMSVAALRAIFARGAGAGRVHVDASSASKLATQFEIIPDGDLQFLGKPRV